MSLILPNGDAQSKMFSVAPPVAVRVGNTDDRGDPVLQSRPYKFYVVPLEDAAVGKLTEEHLQGSRQVNFSGSMTWKEPESISENPQDGMTDKTPGYELFSIRADLQKALQRLAVVENQDPVRRRIYEVRQLDVLGLGLTAWWLHEERQQPRDLFIPLKALRKLVYGEVYEEERFLRIVAENAKEHKKNGADSGGGSR